MAVACQVIGYSTLWSNIFEECDIELNPNLKSHLYQKTYRKKTKQSVRVQMKGKEAYSEEAWKDATHKAFMDGHNVGLQYRKDIKVAAAKKLT